MTKKKTTVTPMRRDRETPADCVSEVRIGNSVLVVSGFFKKNATATAADKMARVLEAESRAQRDFTENG